MGGAKNDYYGNCGGSSYEGPDGDKLCGCGHPYRAHGDDVCGARRCGCDASWYLLNLGDNDD